MQGITHVLAGVLILLYLEGRIQEPYDKALIVILAFLSHGLLDSVAVATYHPPEAMFDDIFWVASHTLWYGLLIVALVLYLRTYWYAILAATLPDLWDWFLVRPVFDWQLGNPELAETVYLHPYVVYQPSWLPDLTMNPLGVLPELVLIVILFTLITRKERIQEVSTG